MKRLTDIEDVALPQLALVRDTMADNFVDGPVVSVHLENSMFGEVMSYVQIDFGNSR